MNFHKSILAVVFLLLSTHLLAQDNPESNKTITPLYEISYKKSAFDFYDQSNYGFILFYKSEKNDDGYQDCLRLSVENATQYKTMNLDYYASLTKEVIDDEYKKIESKKVEVKGKMPYYQMTYEKTIGTLPIKISHRIYFNNGFGFHLFLRTTADRFDELYIGSEKIFNSFKLLN